MRTRDTSAHPRNLFVSALYWATIIGLYLPLAYLVFQAFLTDPYSWKSGFTLEWIGKAIHSEDLWGPLMNSLKIGFISASLAVCIGTLGAVGLTPISHLLPSTLQTLILLPIMLPEVITGLSLLLFFLLCKFPMGMFTVILAHASFSASFVYFIMQEQLKKLDPQMQEAALDLGARPEQTFWKVTFPNILPGIMGGWLLAFTISFDDFLISFFTSGNEVTTLPLKIYSLMRIGTSPVLNAMSFFMICMSAGLVLLLLSKEQSRKWVLKRS